MARHYSHARGRRRTHHRRRNTANRSMVIRDPKGAPSPTAFLKLLYSNIISQDDWNGATLKEFPDGTKRRLPSLFTAYANSLVAVYASSPPPSPPADRFLYAAEWGTLYTFYIVHASRITLKFNSVGASGWLAVWPSLTNAVTGIVPVNQETIFGMPGAKVKYFSSVGAGAGTTRGFETITNYIKMDQFLPHDFYLGSNLVGALPHTSATSGWPYFPGTPSGLPVYWNFQFFSTNEDNSSPVNGDLSIQIENYVELMEPWASDPEHVLNTQQKAEQYGITLASLDRPMIEKYDVQEDYKTVLLDPDFKTGNQKKAEEGVPDVIYPIIEPEPEEFITVKVPKSSVKS